MADPADAPSFESARLIPLNGEREDTDNEIRVCFNPASLRVAVQNQMKAETGSGGGRDRASQFVEKSSTTLTVELVFDTTLPFRGGAGLDLQANDDVRQITGKIAETFVKQEERSDGKLGAPKRLQFRWGAFRFNGMITSYGENLDFFAPEGVPLRATLSLTITEDRFQFLRDESTRAAQRDTPSFAAAPSDANVAGALQNQGKDPRAWRDAALYNGMESPRFAASAAGLGASIGGGISGAAGAVGGAGVASFGATTIGVSASAGVGFSVPSVSAPKGSGAAGFSFGASAKLGTAIPGAFRSR
jgi:hypothetical protein